VQVDCGPEESSNFEISETYSVYSGYRRFAGLSAIDSDLRLQNFY